MLAGGAEAADPRVLVGGFARCARSPPATTIRRRASRPFDRGRDGFVIGEGAGVVVLERSSTPGPAGVEPLAELVGYGATADAYHITLPAPGGSGAVRAVPAGAGEGRASTPTTWSTSTPTRPPRPRATGPSWRRSAASSATRAGEVSVTANKAMLGHTLGAAGAIEAAVTILALRDGVIPPTINLDDPDEAAAGWT